jgi:hypothetical protein
MAGYPLTAPPWVRAFWCALSAMLAAVGIGTAVVAIAAFFQGTAIALVCIPPMAALGWLAGKAAMRIPRSGVTIAPQEVIIAGPLRTWHVPLSEAEAFIAEVRAGNSGQPTVSLERKAGRSIGIWALNRNGFIWNFKRMVTALQPIADDLNARLARFTSSPGASSSPVSEENGSADGQ